MIKLQETVRVFLHPSLLLFGDRINLRRETFPYTHTSKLVAILDKVRLSANTIYDISYIIYHVSYIIYHVSI
jgi:hypothetical protein